MENACGPRLYVVVSDPSPEVTGRLESGLFKRAAGIAEVIAVADEAELPVPCPVRADLREPSSAAARHRAADREPARSGA